MVSRSGLSKRPPSPVVRKKSSPSRPLLQKPGAKEVRDRISDYVNAVISGQTIQIVSRGKTVAILAPPDRLPKGQSVIETVSTTDIKNGKRKISLVAVHGPYAVERGGERVAILYSPVSSMPQMLERLLSELEELRLLDEAKSRRVHLRQRADEAIRARIVILNNSGAHLQANQIEAAHRDIDLKI